MLKKPHKGIRAKQSNVAFTHLDPRDFVKRCFLSNVIDSLKGTDNVAHRVDIASLVSSKVNSSLNLSLTVGLLARAYGYPYSEAIIQIVTFEEDRTKALSINQMAFIILIV